MNTTNERPTPETDAACHETYARGVAHIPLVGFMERLERERDKATENATNYFARLGEVERERDEAREQLRLANIDCYAALTELDAARELADRLAALISKPASEWGWEKVDALAAWKEARND